MALIKPFAETAMREKLASGEYEAAPEIMRLEEGQQITGILEGNGPQAEFIDKMGVVTYVNTWIVADRTGSVRVSLLSSVQLDKKLPGFVGCEVTIARGPQVDVGGGQRMTKYFVMGPRLPGGQRRRWAQEQVIEADTRALPAGNAS